MQRILDQFLFPAPVKDAVPFGNGHINSTFRVETEDGGRYVLQKINKAVFRQPEDVMDNVCAVTDYLSALPDADPDKCLRLLPAKDAKRYAADENGDVWRVYNFIPNSGSFELPDTEELMERAGAGFGGFFAALQAFPAETLKETIPAFHNTPHRVNQLRAAVARDAAGRVKDVQTELKRIYVVDAALCVLEEKKKAGLLPLRVTHNDTKLNNILFDKTTGETLCVVDLDTVMPGLIAYDFGDAIRFAGNTAVEDEKDLSRVSLSLPMLRAFARGYLREAGSALTEAELDSLAMGCWTDTMEIGIRFLTDYIEGDVYFKTDYPEHNLVRARCQLALADDIMRKMPLVKQILREECGK